MKQVKEYSEKEKSIFNGIMDLLNQGYRIHELKVADIAAAAGIGKSTAYEYFTTKEEIIRQAVSYHVCKEYEGFTTIISNQHNFTDIIIKIMDYSVDMLRSRFSSLLFMVLNLAQSDIKQLVCEDSDLLTEIRSSVNEHIVKMFEIGKNEKLIEENVTVEDCKLVLYGMISAFTNEVIFMRNKSLINHSTEYSVGLQQQEEGFKDEDSLIELKERTIRLILKALK